MGVLDLGSNAGQAVMRDSGDLLYRVSYGDFRTWATTGPKLSAAQWEAIVTALTGLRIDDIGGLKIVDDGGAFGLSSVEKSAECEAWLSGLHAIRP